MKKLLVLGFIHSEDATINDQELTISINENSYARNTLYAFVVTNVNDFQN